MQEKLDFYNTFIGQEGFSNVNREIKGTLNQIEQIREGLILGYFEDGTILNLDIIKKDGKFLEDLKEG